MTDLVLPLPATLWDSHNPALGATSHQPLAGKYHGGKQILLENSVRQHGRKPNYR